MKKIRYGLILSDFDGTLVRSDDTIAQSTKDAIAQYCADGGRFAISTGRLPRGILPKAKALGLKGAISCCQGAVIVDIETEEVLHYGAIPYETGLKICRKMEEMDLHTHVYDIWEFYANKHNENLQLYERLTETKALYDPTRKLEDILREKRLNPCNRGG